VNLATTNLHFHLSHLIKFCDLVILEFDDHPSGTDEEFISIIMSVDTSIKNLMDSIKDLLDISANITGLTVPSTEM
jgi:hypothetical protein